MVYCDKCLFPFSASQLYTMRKFLLCIFSKDEKNLVFKNVNKKYHNILANYMLHV
jgi:hypothetical protein